jgi:hypothetical protein
LLYRELTWRKVSIKRRRWMGGGWWRAEDGWIRVRVEQKGSG